MNLALDPQGSTSPVDSTGRPRNQKCAQRRRGFSYKTAKDTPLGASFAQVVEKFPQRGAQTSGARGGTGEENTICVSVLPNCCSRPMNASSSCVEGWDTLMSME